jgi:membrane protein YdbS with pleckstrin-like domain
MWKMRLTEVLVLTVIAAAVVAAATAAAGGTAVAVGVVAAAVLGGVDLWVERRRYLSWSYQERGDDLVVSRGVMFRRLTVVPYGRMQFVDVTAGPWERLFGLSTVKLHTAAAATDARIPGLEPQEAARLRDRLAQLGEAKAAGL